MAYEPTTWKSGDTITSTKLNKIENGITNAGLVKTVDIIVTNDGDTMELNCTWQQLYDWMNAGCLVLAKGGVTSTWNSFEGTGSEEYHHVAPILTVAHSHFEAVGGEIEDSYVVSALIVDGPSSGLIPFAAPASDEHPVYGSSEPSTEPYTEPGGGVK